jgi:hypothetical protein
MADDLQRAVRGETARRSWSAPEPCTDAAADGEALPTELCCEHPGEPARWGHPSPTHALYSQATAR